MFVNGSSLWKKPSVWLRFFFTFFPLWLGFVTIAVGQRAIIKTEFARKVIFGDTVDISIDLDSVVPGFEMGGFDFLLGYDTTAITFLSATMGQLLEDCQWEYFTYRSNSSDSCIDDSCPPELLRIVAVADINNGDFHPSCYGEASGQLFTLTFQVKDDYAFDCLTIPIKWFWMDCGDNGVSSRYGDSLFVSRNVFRYNGVLITQDTTFPTSFGAPNVCVDGTLGAGVRFVDFYSGGVDIICADSMERRGDLNLNGIPYEIADYLLYRNYFLIGLGVFDINVQAQVASSDINADNSVLTLPDFIYMFRVLAGDALPFPAPQKNSSDTVIIEHNVLTRTVSVSYPDSLSALYLVFNGTIIPDGYFPQHDMISSTSPFQTKILISPSLTTHGLETISSGDIFTYSNNGQLISAEATYDGLSVIPTTIVFDTLNCCLYRGNVDMVVGPSGPVDVADLSYLVAYLFAGGPNPPCMEEGNVDGTEGPDGLIDVNDLTYLVAYLFSGGESPPACP